MIFVFDTYPYILYKEKLIKLNDIFHYENNKFATPENDIEQIIKNLYEANLEMTRWYEYDEDEGCGYNYFKIVFYKELIEELRLYAQYDDEFKEDVQLFLQIKKYFKKVKNDFISY